MSSEVPLSFTRVVMTQSASRVLNVLLLNFHVEKSQSKIQIAKVLWGRSTLITRMEAPGRLLPEKLIGGDCVARFPRPV